MGKNLYCLAMALLFVSQSAEAHRKYFSDNTDQNKDTFDNTNEDSDTSHVDVNNNESLKKSPPTDQDVTKPSQNSSQQNSIIPPHLSTDSQMPTALKGIGVPGSPHQQEVLPAPMARDKSLRTTVENSNAQHGHLIQIPKSTLN